VDENLFRHVDYLIITRTKSGTGSSGTDAYWFEELKS
jgi:hypothetical protein